MKRNEKRMKKNEKGIKKNEKRMKLINSLKEKIIFYINSIKKWFNILVFFVIIKLHY